MHMHKTKFEKKNKQTKNKQFSGVPSRGLKLENKTYKLKAYIVLDFVSVFEL